MSYKDHQLTPFYPPELHAIGLSPTWDTWALLLWWGCLLWVCWKVGLATWLPGVCFMQRLPASQQAGVGPWALLGWGRGSPVLVLVHWYVGWVPTQLAAWLEASQDWCWLVSWAGNPPELTGSQRSENSSLMLHHCNQCNHHYWWIFTEYKIYILEKREKQYVRCVNHGQFFRAFTDSAY